MTKRVRAVGVKRQEVDEDQLAVAFLLLSQILYEQTAPESGPVAEAEVSGTEDEEAA